MWCTSMICYAYMSFNRRQLAADVAPITKDRGTAIQVTDVIDRSNRLRRRIATWIDLQAVHMPESIVEREKFANIDGIEGIEGVSAHEIPLFLPSSMPERAARRMRLYEWKLRHGQAHDALHDIRHHLRFLSLLVHHKDQYSRGVAQNTRSVTAIKTCKAKINRGVAKYQAAWMGMEKLHKGLETSIPADWNRYIQVLKREDVRGLADGLLDETEGRRTMSWIWRAEGGLMLNLQNPKTFEDDPGLNEGTHPMQLRFIHWLIGLLTAALKIEWCKLRARAIRWEEEVELLQEEMRRTEVFFKWKSKWWLNRRAGVETDEETKEGLRAYAASQSHVWQSLRSRCWSSWASMAQLFKATLDSEDIDVDTRN